MLVDVVQINNFGLEASIVARAISHRRVRSVREVNEKASAKMRLNSDLGYFNCPEGTWRYTDKRQTPGPSEG
jgi:hypothetical protein